MRSFSGRIYVLDQAFYVEPGARERYNGPAFYRARLLLRIFAD